MNRIGLYVLTLGLFATMPSAAVQAQSLQDEKGYVDIALLENWFDTDPTMEVNIKGTLLRLVAKATQYDDPELSETLTRLKAIQVRAFELRRSDRRKVLDRTSGLTEALLDDGWEVVVRVRDDSEHVHMYMNSLDDVVVGLFVVVIDDSDDEAVFVNLVGEIDPEEFGRVGRKFNFSTK